MLLFRVCTYINIEITCKNLEPNLKGRVWGRNKCVLKDAKICPDYAAIIFFSEKFIFQPLGALRLHKLTLPALLICLRQPFSSPSGSPSPSLWQPFSLSLTYSIMPLCQPFSRTFSHQQLLALHLLQLYSNSDSAFILHKQVFHKFSRVVRDMDIRMPQIKPFLS